jgi:hypothetical protein
MQAVIERKYNTFRGIPKVLSKFTKTIPKRKADSNAPILSIKKIFLCCNAIVLVDSPDLTDLILKERLKGHF